MNKFTTRWRDEAWRRDVARFAGRWAAWQAAKELLRYALELWLQT
ncbi:hypothetical protein [Streptomyces sp. NPDC059593]